MKYGYARVSTLDQDTAMQLTALRNAGCQVIVEERRSAVKTRPQLDALLRQLQADDELIVYRLDRLARSVVHLMAIVGHVLDVGAALRSLTEPIDARTAAGRMFLQVLGSVAEFERALIRERCMAGQLEAVRRGRSIGRPSKLTPQEQNEIVQLYTETGIPVGEIGRAYGISGTRVRTLYLEATGQRRREYGAVRTWYMNNKDR